MFLRTFLALCLLVVCAGCTQVTHTLGSERWFNPSLPIHLQHTFFEQEASFCVQAADQWIPVPDIQFSFQGVRHINGAPNVSVEGHAAVATNSPSPHSFMTGLSGSQVGFWKTVAATTYQGRRETRDRKRCLTSLGWSPTNDTWDGTPSHLNQSIGVNKSVMTAVREGYRHPLVGNGVVALIQMGKSGASGSGLTIHTVEISIYAPEQPSKCAYVLEESWFSTRGEVRCNNGSALPVRIASGSPIGQWIGHYF